MQILSSKLSKYKNISFLNEIGAGSSIVGNLECDGNFKVAGGLLGNIFDPTILEHSRVKICKELLQLLTDNEQKMIEKINKLIGRFVIIYYKNDTIYLINDASGMRSVFYGVINDNFYGCAWVV